MSLNQNISTSMAQLDSFGVIKLTGADNIKFLQGQATINVERLQENELALGAVCNPQGRCVSLFFICQFNDAIWLILKQETIEATIINLKKYAVFFKVDILDCSAEYQLFGLTNISLKDNKLKNNGLVAFWEAKRLAISIISRDKESTIDAVKPSSLTKSNEQSWLFALAKQGVSWLTLPSQSQFLPHNLDLPQLAAVDFKKGCFTGQEVIARMQYKGKLKSHIQLFETQATLDVLPMSTIWSDEKSVAQVICSAKNEDNHTAILALVKDRYLDCKIFRLNDENGPILDLTKAN